MDAQNHNDMKPFVKKNCQRSFVDAWTNYFLLLRHIFLRSTWRGMSVLRNFMTSGDFVVRGKSQRIGIKNLLFIWDRSHSLKARYLRETVEAPPFHRNTRLLFPSPTSKKPKIKRKEEENSKFLKGFPRNLCVKQWEKLKKNHHVLLSDLQKLEN